MTVRLLCDWKDYRNGREYKCGNLLTTDAGTEAGLVAGKQADVNLSGGTEYVPPTAQKQRFEMFGETDPVTGGIGIGGGALSMNGVPVSSSPGRVSGVTAFAGDTQALVRWSYLDPYSTYTIKAGGVVVGTALSGSSSALITGLTNGTAYAFTVTAANQAGPGLESLASNSVTPSVGPVAGLPPLALWLDANQLGLANGANVTSWTDKSGNGRNGVSSGTGYTTFTAPTFLAAWANSKPAVSFSGNGQALTLAGLTAELIGPDASIIIIGACTSLTNSGSQANQQLLTNQRYVAQPLWDDQSGLSVNTSGGNFNAVSAGGLTGSSAITLSAKTILSIDLPGYLYTNGAKGTKRLSSLASTKTPFVIGSNTNGVTLAYTGAVAEVIVTPQQLTQAQRWALEAYAATKYGSTVVQQ